MKDGPPGNCVTCSTFLLLLKMTSLKAMCVATQGVQIMFGKQTCIKQGMGVRGIKDNFTKPEQGTLWIQSFSICSYLSKSLDEMYNDAYTLNKTMQPNRHKEWVKHGRSWIQRTGLKSKEY